MQSPQVFPTLAAGSLVAGATALFQFMNPTATVTKKVRRCVIQNDSLMTLYFRDGAAAVGDLSDASEAAGVLRPGWSVEIPDCSTVAIWNSGASDVYDSGVNKNVFIYGYRSDE